VSDRQAAIYPWSGLFLAVAGFILFVSGTAFSISPVWGWGIMFIGALLFRAWGSHRGDKIFGRRTSRSMSAVDPDNNGRDSRDVPKSW
jgi:hypothetical protein